MGKIAHSFRLSKRAAENIGKAGPRMGTALIEALLEAAEPILDDPDVADPLAAVRRAQLVDRDHYIELLRRIADV